MVWLPDGRICVIVYTQYRRVTDRQRDILPRHSPRYAYALRGENSPHVAAVLSSDKTGNRYAVLISWNGNSWWVSCVCSRKTVYHYRDSVAFDDFPTGQLISSECLLVKKMLTWAWAIFFNVCTNRIVCVLCFQESYRNEAEMVGAFARDTTAGLGIALGCVLLYAIIMSIVASRDCIRQRCRQNFRSNSVSRHSNDAGISIFCST